MPSNELVPQIEPNPNSFQYPLINCLDKQQVHDKILPHVCHVCGKGFFTAFMMKNHMANVHNSDAKSFVCERCGKSFPSSVAFKAHLKSHQMFHMCTFCERIFTAKTKVF